MHEGKQHGLADKIDNLLECNYSLVICPDSSSNDYAQHELLQQDGTQVLVLDHHLADYISKDAIIINNQLSDYPNKEMSGVGIVWQFCRYIDRLLGVDYANDFLDLVALGLTGDMMSLTSTETKYLINKGFSTSNIKNPFIEYMIDKNSFPLTKPDYKSSYSTQACTPMGAAFFIVPFVNAVTRSGTIEEKKLIFNSMLESQAFRKVPSTKRGHKLGEEELLVLQAVRTIGNVKNRQTRAEDAGLELLESMIQEKKMLEHKILLFLLKPNQIEPQIRGLIANKFMAKYQRPCALLTLTNNNTYEGSMRGYTKTGLNSFKELLEQCPEVVYVQGHDNAAGLGIAADQTESFLNRIDSLMSNISTEPIYRVDYYFHSPTSDIDKQRILDIAALNDYWGQDIDRAYVAINFKVTNKNFTVMKSNTLKIALDSKLSLIKFGGTDDDIEAFTTDGWKEINAICKCNVNSWNNEDYPQLIIEDYEIVDSCKYIF